MPENMRCLPRAITVLLRRASLTAKQLSRTYGRDVSRRQLSEIGELIVCEQYAFSGGRLPETQLELDALHELLWLRRMNRILSEAS
jgi:hypothetical protein